MKAKKPTEKTTRKRYSDEFKDQALKRAERDGVAMVAQDLGIAETQIYAWRRKRQIEGTVTEAQRLKEAEVARLKRDMARLESEAADGWTPESKKSVKRFFESLKKTLQSNDTVPEMNIARSLDHWGIISGEILEQSAQISN